jgi:hypothetical protein
MDRAGKSNIVSLIKTFNSRAPRLTASTPPSAICMIEQVPDFC